MRPADLFPASPLPPDSSGGQHLPLAVLRQYVAGTLSAEAQHEVEAHTLRCVRCADVLEGLSQTDLATTDAALTSLQARLQARVAQETSAPSPVVPLWPRRQMIAAVLLLLVAATVWLGVRRTTENPAATSQIALRQPQRSSPARSKAPTTPAPEVAAAPTETTPPATETTAAADAIAAAPIPTEAAAARQIGRQQAVALRARAAQVRPPATATPAAVGAASAVTDNPADTASPDFAKADPSNTAPGREEMASRKSEAYSKARAASPALAARTPPAAKRAFGSALEGRITSVAPAPANTRVVRGRVTDGAGGAALPGVTVRAKGTPLGASTAADGSFALLVPDSVKTLTFSYVGYNGVEQPIVAADTMLALALTPDTRQLSEVVVVRRERPPAPMSVGALPAGGHAAFREYLKKGLDYPEEALKDGKQGTVRLRFVVAVDGSLQDIKVVRSLSKECDAEAIRLLQEGPRWFPAISKGQRTARSVEVNIPFRIE